MFLVPVQVSVLHTPSPAITPTNLLYNVIATPGALLRYRGRAVLAAPLTMTLLLGTLPGVIVGSVLRVEVLSGPQAFYLVIAAVLLPIGAWLAGGRRPAATREPPPPGTTVASVAAALLVGVVGGIYGIGGGSLLAPVLVGLGFGVAEVAPAALASTFLTSIVGVVTYAVLSLRHSGSIAPDWGVGIGIGLGGLAGGYIGTGPPVAGPGNGAEKDARPRRDGAWRFGTSCSRWTEPPPSVRASSSVALRGATRCCRGGRNRPNGRCLRRPAGD